MTYPPSKFTKQFQRALKLNILSKNANGKKYKDNQSAKTVMAPFNAEVAVSVIDQSGPV